MKTAYSICYPSSYIPYFFVLVNTLNLLKRQIPNAIVRIYSSQPIALSSQAKVLTFRWTRCSRRAFHLQVDDPGYCQLNVCQQLMESVRLTDATAFRHIHHHTESSSAGRRGRMSPRYWSRLHRGSQYGRCGNRQAMGTLCPGFGPQRMTGFDLMSDHPQECGDREGKNIH